MPTYGNPHILPPAQCAANTTTFTDSTLTADVTKIRISHINEMRTAISNEFTRRGLNSPSWTDTITANTIRPRKTHIDELRAACALCQSGDCSADTLYCPGDTVTLSWAETITANVTKVRKPHTDELRTAINNLKTSCICETEQCDFCSDCGHSWLVCNNNGVACNNHQGGGCIYFYQGHQYCGSINVGGTKPYRSANSGTNVAWDGYVDYEMGTTPPGTNWSAYWTCKCNPFTWN